MSQVVGHRVRKMRRTRARIIESAETLFRERGYLETTIAEIADKAEVSPATVYNYFGSKDDILFADYEALRADLCEALARRQERSTIDATREWIASRRRELRDVESDRLHRGIIDHCPALQAQERLRMSHIERDLAVEVARDLGESADALRPRIVAAAIAAVFLATLQHGAENAPGDGDPFTLLDHGSAFLTAGFDAVAALAEPPY